MMKNKKYTKEGIEQKAIKILFEDNSRDINISDEKHLFNDMIQFGGCYQDQDGKRIHPMDIIINKRSD